ncbi:hypothetical protein GCM10009813_07010 [Brevibacterium marinum]
MSWRGTGIGPGRGSTEAPPTWSSGILITFGRASEAVALPDYADALVKHGGDEPYEVISSSRISLAPADSTPVETPELP